MTPVRNVPRTFCHCSRIIRSKGFEKAPCPAPDAALEGVPEHLSGEPRGETGTRVKRNGFSLPEHPGCEAGQKIVPCGGAARPEAYEFLPGPPSGRLLQILQITGQKITPFTDETDPPSIHPSRRKPGSIDRRDVPEVKQEPFPHTGRREGPGEERPRPHVLRGDHYGPPPPAFPFLEVDRSCVDLPDGERDRFFAGIGAPSGEGDVTSGQTTPSFLRASNSSAERPRKEVSTPSVCWPRRGAGSLTSAGVSENFTGTPGIFMAPATG